MRSYLIISTLLIFLSTLFFMVAVLLRKRIDRQSIIFSIFGLSVAWWSFSYTLWQLSTSAASALFWCKMLVLGSTFIPVTYLQFVCDLTGYRRRPAVGIALLAALIISGLNAGPYIVNRVEPVASYPFWPIAGSAFGLYLGHFVLFVVYSFYLLLKKYRESGPQVRNQLQYLIIGTAIGYAGCSTNFFLWLEIPIGPLGQGFGILYILGIGYSVIKYRLLEFNELFLRLVTILFAALGLSWLVSLASFTYAFDLPLNGGSSKFLRYWGILGFFSIGLFLILPLLNSLFEQGLAIILQGSRVGYRTQLKNLAGKLSQMEDEQTIFRELIRSLQELIPARRLAVYYRTEFDPNFQLRKGVGESPLFPDTLQAGEIAPIQSRVLKSNQSILFGELGETEIKQVSDTLRESPGKPAPIFLEDDLLVPLSSGPVLDGLLVLGSRMDGKIYSEVDISLLEYLCSQIAIAIRSRKIERQAAQVDNLVSLGTLAAGLAHELKNPLVSIKTLGSLLRNPEPPRDWAEDPAFISVVHRDIDRISNIIENVATFAENPEVKFSPVNLDEVLKSAHGIFKHRLNESGITLKVEPLPPVPVRGNFNQLVQVFLNLLENSIVAVEAVDEKQITISGRTRILDEEETWVEIIVRDSGKGIPESMIPRIFDPFITSKDTGPRSGKTGSGLGLAIVKRIVEAHKGTISIENASGTPGVVARLRLAKF